MKPSVVLYTDGSTFPRNPGHGGWGAVLIAGDRVRGLSGYVAAATNNSMEASAVLHGLEVLKRPCRVQVCTDSMYVVYGLRAIKRGKLLKTNVKIWEAIREQLQRHDISIVKVPGHSGVAGNEYADQIASAAAKNKKGVSIYSDSIPETRKRRKEKRTGSPQVSTEGV